MGRTMPTECPHGAIIDWGDFGAEDGSSLPEPCAECAQTVECQQSPDGRHAFAGVLRGDVESKTEGRCEDCGARFAGGEWGEPEKDA